MTANNITTTASAVSRFPAEATSRLTAMQTASSHLAKLAIALLQVPVAKSAYAATGTRSSNSNTYSSNHSAKSADDSTKFADHGTNSSDRGTNSSERSTKCSEHGTTSSGHGTKTIRLRYKECR